MMNLHNESGEIFRKVNTFVGDDRNIISILPVVKTR